MRPIILLEGHSQQDVEAFPGANSAYPFRISSLFVAPVVRRMGDDQKFA